MTQLDLPQVSMQRYFDLLKRRRWQVVPVSLLGLLVGGLVAFLIPRYFVAEMPLTYKSAPGDAAVGARDPVALMVENARLTIPDAVGDTLVQLGWTDYSSLPATERRDYERALRQRLDILDVSPSGRERTFAKLHLTYKDRDGLRAKTFLETLIATWVAKELEAMRDKARLRQLEATAQLQHATRAFDNFSSELKQVQLRAELWPSSSPSAEQDLARSALQQHEKLLQDIRDLTGKQIELEQEGADLSREIELTPQKLDNKDALDPEFLVEPAKTKAVALKARRKAFENLGEAHPDRATRELELQQAEAELQQLLALTGVGTGQNPRLVQLREKQKRQRTALHKTSSDLEQAQKDLQQLETRQRDLTDAFDQQRRLSARMDASKQLKDAAQAQFQDAVTARGLLNDNDPITYVQAWVPPAPTDPNILLVAMIGCVIGLGVAIGLILAIDLLQGTYKTIDDVERGLSVPVLGGMSHIETEEHKAQTAGSRKRASLFAGSFVVLMVVVVTWYYREPTSLPPFVRDLLSMVLGQG